MIAYFILAHRYPHQFKRLFKSIYHADNHYLIHIDKGAEAETVDDITLFLKDYDNASILESKDAIWGGYSLVDAALRGIKKLVNMDVKWEYFINLSGQDFPLKSQAEILSFLNLHKGVEFIKVADQAKIRPETLHRIKDYVQEVGDKLEIDPLANRMFLKGVTPYIGNQWMILSRAFCEFITYSPELKKFENFYRNTLIADEGFFQTVLMNTTFKSVIVSDDKREIDWVASDDIKLRPRDFVRKDSVVLLNSKNLFARKFDEQVDSAILGILEDSLTSLPVKERSAATAKFHLVN